MKKYLMILLAGTLVVCWADLALAGLLDAEKSSQDIEWKSEIQHQRAQDKAAIQLQKQSLEDEALTTSASHGATLENTASVDTTDTDTTTAAADITSDGSSDDDVESGLAAAENHNNGSGIADLGDGDDNPNEPPPDDADDNGIIVADDGGEGNEVEPEGDILPTPTGNDTPPEIADPDNPFERL